MFKKKNTPYQDIDSFISIGVEIKGKMQSQGSIRIDGSIEGEVSVKGDVIVGEKGFIRGETKTNNIMIAGTIEGNVFANGKVEITNTGIMNGDIACAIIVIDEGGQLNGTTKMNKEVSTEISKKNNGYQNSKNYKKEKDIE